MTTSRTRFLSLLVTLALVLALVPILSPAVPTDAAMTAPPGKVFLLGGAIKNNNSAIFNAMRTATGKTSPRIAVFCSGTTDLVAAQKEYASAYQNLLTGYGFVPVFIPIAVDNYAAAAFSSANVALVAGCDAVFFNGGWQERHTRVLYNDDGTATPLMTAVQGVFARGGLIAGTSAGCNVQGTTTYGDGTSYGYLKANHLIPKLISDVNTADPNNSANGGTVKGLGFLSAYGALADSHFMARGRFARPLVAMRDTGLSFAIGVDEDTGFLLSGTTGTVYGAGGVTVFDATTAQYGTGTWFSATGVLVSYLTTGDRFDFSTRIMLPAAGKTLLTGTGKVYASTNIFGAGEAAQVMTTLAQAKVLTTTGVSTETAPRFTVTFTKTAGITKTYYDAKTRKVAVDRMVVGVTGQ